jgi:flagellar basal-body rod protein FlgC
MFDVLDMGASGLEAQRARMDTIAANIMNLNTTRDAQGRKIPYRRRFTVFAPGQVDGKPGVRAQVKIDHSPFQKRYEPGNPDADKSGYVKYPNINLPTEYVNAMEASRAYEANVTMMETSKAMLNSALRLIA